MIKYISVDLCTIIVPMFEYDTFIKLKSKLEEVYHNKTSSKSLIVLCCSDYNYM